MCMLFFPLGLIATLNYLTNYNEVERFHIDNCANHNKIKTKLKLERKIQHTHTHTHTNERYLDELRFKQQRRIPI